MKATIVRNSTSAIGTFAGTLRKAGVEFSFIEAWRDDLPADFDPLAPDLLIVMGGAPGPYQSDIYPFIGQEIRALEKRLAADVPTLGICLGAQLMAAALGAKTYNGREAGKAPERGWFELIVNEQGRQTPVRHLDAALTRVAQFHQDTFDLPAGATLLASTELYPNQVFAFDKNALALQCHPETDHEKIRDWLVSSNIRDRAEMDHWRAETALYLPAMMRQSEKWLIEWVGQVCGTKESKVA